MCGTRIMVDIMQSPSGEISDGKKKKEQEERTRKIETTGVKYNGLPITMGGHKKERRNHRTKI